MVETAALAAHRALELEIYSRVDIILDPVRGPQVLEVNTIPGMTETSLLPEAAAAAGISMSQLCEFIVQLSLKGGWPASGDHPKEIAETESARIDLQAAKASTSP